MALERRLCWLLVERARRYLEPARVNLASGRFDVSSIEAEIAAQPALKAPIVKLGLEPRVATLYANYSPS